MIVNSIEQITHALINYDNKNNLSWMGVYRAILTKFHIEDKINDYKLLNDVIHNLTILGYDIIPTPFKLKKYR